jgi:hypothetical protein
MIKVGQIYKENLWTYTVTHIEYGAFPDMNRVFLILRNGSMMTEAVDTFKLEVEQGFVKLIAEYPTWQEAINSKEFKGE